MRICVCNQKGGSGKSTIALSLATEFHHRGKRVLVGDADPQRTALTWAAAGQGDNKPTVIGLHDGFHRPGQLPDDGFDLTVIDTPARLAGPSRSALMVADLAIIPVCSGGIETWALAETLQTVGEAQVMRPQLRAIIVINRHDKRTAMGKSTKEALDGCGVPVARSMLGTRVAYVEAMTAGQGPCTYAPGTAAAKEIAALATEILGVMRHVKAVA